MAICNYCGEKEATQTCEVCGSRVCGEHKREHGCDTCGGGITKFE